VPESDAAPEGLTAEVKSVPLAPSANSADERLSSAG
jgi:hypothetical protein